MKIRLAMLAVAALTYWFTASEAKAVTGNEMLSGCTHAERYLVNKERGKSPHFDETLMLGRCVGQVMGIKFLANGFTKDTEHPICVPDNVTNGQVLSVVVRHLRDHPDTRNNDFNNLVMDALFKAWPCQKP